LADPISFCLWCIRCTTPSPSTQGEGTWVDGNKRNGNDWIQTTACQPLLPTSHFLEPTLVSTVVADGRWCSAHRIEYALLQSRSPKSDCIAACARILRKESATCLERSFLSPNRFGFTAKATRRRGPAMDL